MEHDIKWVVNCWGGVHQAICIENDRFVILKWADKPPLKAGRPEKAWRGGKGIHPETINAIHTLFKMQEIVRDGSGHLIVQFQAFQMSNIRRIQHPSQLEELRLP